MDRFAELCERWKDFLRPEWRRLIKRYLKRQFVLHLHFAVRPHHPRYYCAVCEAEPAGTKVEVVDMAAPDPESSIPLMHPDRSDEFVFVLNVENMEEVERRVFRHRGGTIRLQALEGFRDRFAGVNAEEVLAAIEVTFCGEEKWLSLTKPLDFKAQILDVLISPFNFTEAIP